MKKVVMFTFRNQSTLVSEFYIRSTSNVKLFYLCMLFMQTGVRYFRTGGGTHLTAILRNALTVCHHLGERTCHGSAWHVPWTGIRGVCSGGVAGVRGEGRCHQRWKLRELPGVSRCLQTQDANESSRSLTRRVLQYTRGRDFAVYILITVN